MTDPRLGLLDELAQADEKLGRALRELDDLLRETVALRTAADRVSQVLVAGPAERKRIAASMAEAQAHLREREEALNEAGAELADAEERGGEERLAAARRFEVRARDAVAVASRSLDALGSEQRELEERLAGAEREAPSIEERARGLADSLHDRPRLASEAGHEPRAGLDGVAEWSSGARAALLVARGTVATEREGVLRQANELGSALLGESLATSSAAIVARRVADALRD